VPLGFDPSRVQTFQVALPPGRYPGEQIKTFAETLTTRLRAMPGVHAAGYATQVPMVALMNRLFVRRTPAAPEPGRRGEDARFVSTDYLKAMGVRLLAGRAFEASDSEGRPRVIVINQTLARQLFPGEGSIGQVVYIDSPKLAEPWSIIGIVEDVRQSGVSQEPEPQLFIDMRQWPGVPPGFAFLQYFALRTEGDPATVLPQVRDVVRQVDPQGAIYNVASMDLIVSNAVARPRMYAVLLGIFASVAVLLAVIGIYGVMAYAVAQRTRELGIRIALGARRAQVLGLVLRQSLALIVIGIALGLSGAAAVTRYLKGLLFGLTPLDTPTFLAVSLTFALVATLASYLPARRATRIDPLIALRDE
jgi:putative ABC transport system permease protein